MRESIAENLRMVMLDIDVGSMTAEQRQDLKPFVFNTGTSNGEIKGKVLKSGNGRVILLGTDEKIYSLPDPGSVSTTPQ
ncbi:MULTISPECIES: hypothetical protein [Paraburkholderia]|uniref:hypothetical protein n=1 Tax=Paraburkholderia TaxID=1822464 RepID=UPI00225871CD|nr:MULTISPECIES: hypothetical protein [Paraburkholderia]MCX4166224.1 hypothetical protein [Paraburkholderia megapolitana]MDN7161714.1 hypothetical protein [Paraburkholderia sp. CHISQ3]MDQ6498762.1 hypothetical protein [Paraburkholderia megapolitana]